MREWILAALATLAASHDALPVSALASTRADYAPERRPRAGRRDGTRRGRAGGIRLPVKSNGGR
jgi:hypothetical protein